MDDIPFDLRGLRIITYDKNLPNWSQVLQQSIELAIRETLAAPNETIPTVFLNPSEIKRESISPDGLDILVLKEDMEQLKREVRSRNSIPTNLNMISNEAYRENEPQVAIDQILKPSKQLAVITGPELQTRTEIVKKVWSYIKKHKLQDTKNRRMINTDDVFKVIFGNKAQISMFEIAKVVSKHVK